MKNLALLLVVFGLIIGLVCGLLFLHFGTVPNTPDLAVSAAFLLIGILAVWIKIKGGGSNLIL